MRASLYVIASLLVLAPATVAAQPAPSATATVPAEQALAGFDTYVRQTLEAWAVPGVAIALVRDGKVILSKGYGVADPASGAAMTAETIFPIASMSKAFTAFGAGLLVDEGKMSFDAPVVTYIPGLSFHDPAATQGLNLRDMLSHRSGMPRHDAVWYHNAALTPEGLVERMPHLEPTAGLRARWQYNNNMFVLSGLAIKNVSGSTYERFVEQRIFRPLGMESSTFSPEVARRSPHIGGREVLNGRAITVPMFRNTEILNPAGGVYSNVDDLANWMLVNLDGGRLGGQQVIQPSTLADIHRTHMASPATIRDAEYVPVGYGLGWFTNMYRGHRMVQHGGNLPGISTMVMMLPDQNLGVTVLVNHGGSELRDALARQLLDRLLGATGKDWVGEALARKTAREASEVAARGAKGGSRVAGTIPSHPLSAYAGTYHHPGYGPITVRLEDDRLMASYNDDSAPLDHWHYNVFDAATTDPQHILLDARLQFVGDVAGRIAELRIPIETSLPPATFRKQADARLSDPGYLRTLAGTYELSGNRISVSVAAGKLLFQSPGGAPAALLPGLDGTFTHPMRQDAEISFRADVQGRPTALVLTDSSGVYVAQRVD
jgi:CubicO group peptidase (beta-lactamase class C family)